MATRLPASQRTREELTSLIEGRLSTGSAKDELVKLATRLIAAPQLRLPLRQQNHSPLPSGDASASTEPSSSSSSTTGPL